MSGEAQDSGHSGQATTIQTESEKPLYMDEVFWYKLDVDYQRASTLAESSEDDTPNNLQYALLSQFVTRKKPVITESYSSADDFKFEVIASSDPRSLILDVYVNYLWIQNSEGDHFESKEDSIKDIKTISDSNSLVVERATSDFSILWPGSASIEKELNNGEVTARRYLQANPVILKEGENGFEVRGRIRDRKKISNKFRSDENTEQIEPERVDESVINRIEKISNTHNDQFKVIGVKFDRSSLPQNSRLEVRNERAIYDDLDVLEDKDIASIDGMSNVRKIFVKDVRDDHKFAVSVNHDAHGFVFELEATQKLDRERNRFKNGFNAITGLEFGKVYDYDAQDQKYLLNNILTGDGDAYDRYYDSLDEDLQEFLDEAVSVNYNQVKLCKDCSEENDADVEKCTNCGVDDFSDTWEKTVLEIDDDEVLAQIEEVLSEETPVHDRLTVTDWSVESREMAGRDIGRAELNAVVSDGTGVTSRHHRLNIIPLGNHPKPGTVDNYLLKTIFITYGGSEDRSYQAYGRISLYEYLTSSNKCGLVGKATHNTLVGLNDRVSTKASETQEIAREYFRLADEAESIHKNSEELADIYDPDDGDYFEKHVFYLLKSLFAQTERWGRQFKPEPDGLLVIPKESSSEQGSSDYYVATYDAKISHAKSGYDLNKAEEDKAVRYVLEEGAREGIENKTGDEGISSHIFISQNFDQGDFGKIAGNIEESLQKYAGKERVRVIFMEYRSLLELYNISQDHWRELGDSRISSSFDQYVKTALKDETADSNGRYVHFNSDSISEIRSKLLERIDGFNQSQLEYYPGRS